jgi:Pyruvate kinase, barrel domain
MKITPVRFQVVPVLAALSVGFVNSFSSSSPRRSNVSPSALASTTIDPIFTPVKPLDRESRQTSVAATPKVAQRWRKRTKQLATLGPASSTFEMIETLFLAGADIFRLNFSHGSQEQKKELLMMIREVEEKYSHPIAILGDLQGPKLRVSSPTLQQLLSLLFFRTLVTQRY